METVGERERSIESRRGTPRVSDEESLREKLNGIKQRGNKYRRVGATNRTMSV